MKISFNRTLKLSLMVLVITGFIVGLNLSEQKAKAYGGGPDPSLTNAPAFGALPAEQTCTACHTGSALNSGVGVFRILNAPASYVPNQEYTITVSLNQASRARYGFQLTVLDSTGKYAGTLASATAADPRLQIVNADPGSIADRKYIQHTSNGNTASSTNQSDWVIKWKAPATRVGKITFYAAGNAANGAGSGGDFIYTTSASMTPDAVTQNTASGTTSDLTPSAIASVYGLELATTTATGTDTDPNVAGIQLPTTLGGTTVSVRDLNGTPRLAPLFYVSPGQINYQIPSPIGAGAATVTITNSAGGISTSSINIVTVAPGVFTVLQNGTGLAAAEVQRVTPANVQTFEPTVAGNLTAIPIDWKNATDNLYLVLYGTGLRNLSAITTVNVRIGNTTFTNLPAVYAGPQNFFVGVDQVNVLLPRTLVGSGLVDAVLTVDGKVANTVKLNFK